MDDVIKEQKKPNRMFKYSADMVEKQLLDISQNCQRELQEAFSLHNMRQFIKSYEAGYRQALLDYKIVTQSEIDNG